MIEIEKPNITTVELSEDGSYGEFVIEPLERGYGLTLGNSLRRILHSWYYSYFCSYKALLQDFRYTCKDQPWRP